VRRGKKSDKRGMKRVTHRRCRPFYSLGSSPVLLDSLSVVRRRHTSFTSPHPVSIRMQAEIKDLGSKTSTGHPDRPSYLSITALCSAEPTANGFSTPPPPPPPPPSPPPPIRLTALRYPMPVSGERRSSWSHFPTRGGSKPWRSTCPHCTRYQSERAYEPRRVGRHRKG